MESVKEILHKNNLKGTSARIAILNTIISSEAPLSESDIKKRIHEIDREPSIARLKVCWIQKLFRV